MAGKETGGARIMGLHRSKFKRMSKFEQQSAQRFERRIEQEKDRGAQKTWAPGKEP